MSGMHFVTRLRTTSLQLAFTTSQSTCKMKRIYGEKLFLSLPHRAERISFQPAHIHADKVFAVKNLLEPTRNAFLSGTDTSGRHVS